MRKLWLSPDFDPANKVRIAYHNDWNQPYEWDKRATQQSNPITFEAGQTYYVEAIFKERDRHDNGAVAWQGPGIPERAVVDGSFLSPVHDGECTSVAYHLSGLSEQLELGSRLDITFAGQPVDAADLPCGHHYAFDHQTDLAQVIAGMGLNYFGARCYDAEIGLWIAVDRKREAWSPYTDMLSDPVNGFDPNGAFRVSASERIVGGYNEKGIPRDIVVAEYQIHKAMVVEDAKGVPSSVIGYLLKNPIVGKLAGKLLSNLMDKIDPTASAMKEGVGLRAEIAFDEQIPEEYYMKVYSVDEFNEKMNEFSAYEGSDLLRPIDETKDEAIKRSSLFPNKEAVEVK